MERLNDLEVVESQLTDISGLQYATNLQTLSLHAHNVSDITPLTQLSKLTNLTLSTGLNDQDLKLLANLKNLTHLDLHANYHIRDVSPLTSLTNLTNLDLSDNDISDVKPLASLTNLTSLDLSENDLSDVSSLASLPNLTDLKVSKNILIHLEQFTRFPGLTSLSLDEIGLSDLEPLTRIPKLTKLSLTENYIDNAKLTTLAKLTNLTELKLYHNQISDVSPLASLTNLTDLDLRNNQLNDIKPLASLTNLNYLWLDDNQIDNINPLADIAKTKDSYYLSIGGNQISDMRSFSVKNLGQYYGQKVIREIPMLSNDSPSYELSFTFYNPAGASPTTVPFMPTSENGLHVIKKDDSNFIITWDKQTPLDTNKEYLIAKTEDSDHKLFVKMTKADTSSKDEAVTHKGNTDAATENNQQPVNQGMQHAPQINLKTLPKTGDVSSLSLPLALIGFIVSSGGSLIFYHRRRS